MLMFTLSKVRCNVDYDLKLLFQKNMSVSYTCEAPTTQS